MNHIPETFKHYRYLIIPLVAIMLMIAIYPAYLAFKNQPTDIDETYHNLAIRIQQHIRTVDTKRNASDLAETLNWLHASPSATDPDVQSMTDVNLTPMEVRGISFISGNALAFIGDRVLREGDWIGEFKIDKIERTGLFFSDRSGKQTRILLNPDNN